MNTGTIIDAAAAGAPSRAALIIDGHHISYAGLATAARQCAAGLTAHGIGAGDRVAVVDSGSLLSIATVLGAARIGAVAALMNPALTPPELRGLIKNSNCADVAVAGEPYIGRLREAGAATVLSESDLFAEPSPTFSADITDTPDDGDALILFTSGTTGLPKPIAISNGRLSMRIEGMARPFRADAQPAVGMMSVPFFHVGGALGILGSLYAGNTAVVQKRFDAGEWLRLVSENGVTTT
ncbi:MAG: class I adenylate-forming enzyme family protein, partial [Mycobacterium sp.]